MDREIEQILNEINFVVKGKEEVTGKVIAAILAGGHVLLEDIPGVGKTTLALAIAGTMSLDYRRIQFTPDVLPSDIVGFTIYNSASGEFEYRKGAVFCNLFLADELNRTSSKTQSALLEAMEEGRVTVDGITYALPKPFVVIATENPIGSSGTQQLPESQLDRFMICLSMGYPSHSAAIDILKNNEERPLDHLKNLISPAQLAGLQKRTEEIYVSDAIYEYIVRIVEGTRADHNFSLGVSPRGSIALLKMSKAMAVLRGGDFVIPEDVMDCAADVLSHRVRLDMRAKSDGVEARKEIEALVRRIRVV